MPHGLASGSLVLLLLSSACFIPPDGSDACEDDPNTLSCAPESGTGNSSTGVLGTTTQDTTSGSSSSSTTGDGQAETGSETAAGSTGGSTGTGTDADTETDGPSDACTLLVFDDFEREDSTDVGTPPFPGDVSWAVIVGEVEISSGRLIRGAGDSFAYLTLDQGELLDLDGLRIRLKMRRVHSTGVALLGINGNVATRSPRYHPGFALANAGLLYYDGAISGASVAVDGYTPETDYYLEMHINRGMASATVATGDFASEGGVVVATLPEQLVAESAGQTLRLSMDDNAAGQRVEVDMVSVERC